MVAEQRETVQRIDADTIDIASNVSGAQRELLKYYASISSNRWLMLKVFGVLIVFVSPFILVSHFANLYSLLGSSLSSFSCHRLCNVSCTASFTYGLLSCYDHLLFRLHHAGSSSHVSPFLSGNREFLTKGTKE